MKIGIYAPAKNEIKHVKQWYDSCSGADVICVADTGSTDGTREALLALGVRVTDLRIIPWRFDDAFNSAMYLLPEDIDVCIRLDMDERLQPGWRNALEKDWTSATTRLRYEYVWNWNPDGTPGQKWWGDRIHARKNYRWMGATHEGLYCRGQEVETFSHDLKIWQFPDPKNKKNDLPLLIESHKEWPHDARITAYLGREYFYQKDFQNSAKTYKKFLDMPSNSIERGQAMINLSVAEPANREKWLNLAILEIPDHREPLVQLAQYYYEIASWQKCADFAERALAINNHPLSYICTREAWGSLPHDLLSIALWNLNRREESLAQAKLALSKEQSNKRLLGNVLFIETEILKEKQ